MSGREVPPIGPDDGSDESVVDRIVRDIHSQVDYSMDSLASLDDIFVPLTEEELAEGHPAPEIVGLLLESVQAHMAYFQVADADKITVDQIQRLNPDVYYDPLKLEDLVLIVVNELNQSDADSPISTPLGFEKIIEASNRIEINSRLNEETEKAVTVLAVSLFGQSNEKLLFKKSIESPTLARKLRRFSWLVTQPYMKAFPAAVRREQAASNYAKKLAGDSQPSNWNFPKLVNYADKYIRGLKVEVDDDLLNLNPHDIRKIFENRKLAADISRAIAVNETVAKTDI